MRPLRGSATKFAGLLGPTKQVVECYNVSLAPFGCAEAQWLTTGQMLIIGVEFDRKLLTLKQLATELRSCKGPDLKHFVKVGKSCVCVLNAKEMLLIPAGFMNMTFCPQTCTGFRWSLTNHLQRMRRKLFCRVLCPCSTCTLLWHSPRTRHGRRICRGIRRCFRQHDISVQSISMPLRQLHMQGRQEC